MKTLVLTLALLSIREATAQPTRCGPEPTRESFLACARAGTERYRDQAAAVLDGYRRVGRDFPAMGEHWIRIGLVFDGAIDPARPEVLSYVLVEGRPRLLGVAYVLPLLGGEQPPDHPAGPEAWHDHSRTLEDETMLPMHHTTGQGVGARMAMLHAWIWSPNPAGVFGADNWAIPSIRLGLDPGTANAGAAAKALSLAAGGREYFELAIRAAAGPTPDERSRLDAAMDHAQTRAEAAVGELRESRVDDDTSRMLVSIWAELWQAVDGALGAEARSRMSHLPFR
jgi:hypothetical protein